LGTFYQKPLDEIPVWLNLTIIEGTLLEDIIIHLWLAFITDRNCVICRVRAEAEERINYLNTTVMRKSVKQSTAGNSDKECRILRSSKLSRRICW